VLLHAALFFGFLAAATTLVAMLPGAISGRFWYGLPLGLALIGLAGSLGSVLGDSVVLDNELAGIALVAVILARLWQKRWSWLGAQLFATATLSALAYLLYVGALTYAIAHSPVYLLASTLLLILELAALGLSVSYLFEIVDALSRRPDPVKPPDANFLPKIAVQVPAYNEPIEVVTETLKSLAALDYPELVVQVVDNNTPDEKNWRALDSLCKQLGPRFQFMHLENWPGFKAGALNEATKRLPEDIEIIGEGS